MRAVRALVLRLISSVRSVTGRDPDDASLREELASHLAMHIEENVRRGMPLDEARRAALIAAGGLTLGAEAVREQRGLPLIESLASDVRYAIRGLRNKPGFALAVMLTLALGIGANTAMFTIVNAVVLRPLPYAEPDRIVSLSQMHRGEDILQVDDHTYFAWRDGARSVTLGAYSGTLAAITTHTGTDLVRGTLARDDYFDIFGARPMFGRTFTDDEIAVDGPKVVILGETLWRTRFGADPGILGKSIDIDGVPTNVIGVMPATFVERRAQFWTPFRIRSRPDGVRFMFAVGRLHDGVSIAAAAAELHTIEQRVVAATPTLHGDTQLVVRTLHDRRFGDRRKPLLILFAAVIVLLLIACANLVNLNLARANGRRREVAVRLALGATRWRIVRSMLSESLLLSIAGAVVGIVVARVSITYLVHLSPAAVGNADNISIDTSVLVFTLAIAVLTGIAFGLSPAITASRGDINSVLTGSGGRAAGSKRFQVIRNTLVVAQLSTALLLLTVAGLVARSFRNATSIDAGFRADHLVAVTVPLPLRHYADERGSVFFTELLSRIRAMPGVADAALTDAVPLGGRRSSVSAWDINSGTTPPIDILAVGPRYFETMGVRPVSGRSFTDADRPGAQPVTIINATMARRTFGASNPIGRTMRIGSEQRLVVGVFADVLQGDLEKESTPLVYFPMLQAGIGPGEKVMMRVPGLPDAIEAAILDLVRTMDPAVPPPTFQTGEDILREATAPRQFTFVLLGIFATIAGSLAIVGLYGLLSHLVADRTREIGIRIALGADRRRVLRLVLGQGLALAVIGVAIGVGVSLIAVRAAQSLMFGVSVYDVRTFATSAAALVGVSLLASLLPARRASGVDPVIALRAE